MIAVALKIKKLKYNSLIKVNQKLQKIQMYYHFKI
jgi:hypothetical protein